MADTITAEKLCMLTGLTDRRHRQIADKGYFPPPVKGEYQAGASIAGMFRYYKDQLAKKDNTLDVEKRKYMKARRERAEMETAIMRGEYVTGEDVAITLRNVSLHQKAVLQTKLETELPPHLLGLSVVDIGLKMREVTTELCRIWREGVAKWTKEPPQT